MEILQKVYEIYKEDLQTEDNPPIKKISTLKEGDIVELKGNIYIYLWKKTDYGFLGLLATPYTLLAHPSHPRVKTDSPLYEYMAITDLYYPLTEEVIRKNITDLIKVLTDRKILEGKIEKSIKREKIYHPIREQFLRNEIRRTQWILDEFLNRYIVEEETKKGAILLKLPKKVLEEVKIPERLAAESEQTTAENEKLLVIKQDTKTFNLLVKDIGLLGKKVKLFLGNKEIFSDILYNELIIVETEVELTPQQLADLIRLEEV
jgi:hypothetical protein